MIIIGIDPDSERHGIAIYEAGTLTELKTGALMDVYQLAAAQPDKVFFSIENVMANQFVYARNQHSNKAAQSKIAMHIGRCQQSQVELMRALDSLNVPYILHSPTKHNWAKNKKLFETATGWGKQSNEDTRSAAYFGYLAVLDHKRSMKNN